MNIRQRLPVASDRSTSPEQTGFIWTNAISVYFALCHCSCSSDSGPCDGHCFLPSVLWQWLERRREFFHKLGRVPTWNMFDYTNNNFDKHDLTKACTSFITHMNHTSIVQRKINNLHTEPKHIQDASFHHAVQTQKSLSSVSQESVDVAYISPRSRPKCLKQVVLVVFSICAWIPAKILQAIALGIIKFLFQVYQFNRLQNGRTKVQLAPKLSEEEFSGIH